MSTSGHVSALHQSYDATRMSALALMSSVGCTLPTFATRSDFAASCTLTASRLWLGSHSAGRRVRFRAAAALRAPHVPAPQSLRRIQQENNGGADKGAGNSQHRSGNYREPTHFAEVTHCPLPLVPQLHAALCRTTHSQRPAPPVLLRSAFVCVGVRADAHGMGRWCYAKAVRPSVASAERSALRARVQYSCAAAVPSNLG